MAAEVRSREGRSLAKNVMQFSLYRKFAADATITFDTPDPIPEDQLDRVDPPGARQHRAIGAENPGVQQRLGGARDGAGQARR